MRSSSSGRVASVMLLPSVLGGMLAIAGPASAEPAARSRTHGGDAVAAGLRDGAHEPVAQKALERSQERQLAELQGRQLEAQRVLDGLVIDQDAADDAVREAEKDLVSAVQALTRATRAAGVGPAGPTPGAPGTAQDAVTTAVRETDALRGELVELRADAAGLAEEVDRARATLQRLSAEVDAVRESLQLPNGLDQDSTTVP